MEPDEARRYCYRPGDSNRRMPSSVRDVYRIVVWASNDHARTTRTRWSGKPCASRAICAVAIGAIC